ncbi:uncharacterized protein SPPG_06851 [Spizellomyces punctatus DAOM BR117]|uniref:HCP-like protein n=1 Tax=Spizellomyces punctatus (strain DAOM BR117) TaxID=645134 RepID=A0A0L0H8J5_SPIPD|nr:uncharacterized protein SPPG_06851 [Spizellomyces punctatus DAOM BR117]KNC97855.1 hypothetical protein SPPG_06851 [Spizellomyces punctatus DAOM BR117]|eukprot:XP_016605895.1 hypothetical protein SPPG_06851 [Spizellomyces punctatus DAOM BR117]
MTEASPTQADPPSAADIDSSFASLSITNGERDPSLAPPANGSLRRKSAEERSSLNGIANGDGQGRRASAPTAEGRRSSNGSVQGAYATLHSQEQMNGYAVHGHDTVDARYIHPPPPSPYPRPMAFDYRGYPPPGPYGHGHPPAPTMGHYGPPMYPTFSRPYPLPQRYGPGGPPPPHHQYYPRPIRAPLNPYGRPPLIPPANGFVVNGYHPMPNGYAPFPPPPPEEDNGSSRGSVQEGSEGSGEPRWEGERRASETESVGGASRKSSETGSGIEDPSVNDAPRNSINGMATPGPDTSTQSIPPPPPGAMPMMVAPGMGHGGVIPMFAPGPYPVHQSFTPPMRPRSDPDNMSFRSMTSVNTTQTTPSVRSAILSQGESLEVYRQTAKRSNDPQVQLDFAKHLIATGEGIDLDQGDPKKQKKTQEALFQEALKWIKKLATNGGIGKSAFPDAQFFLAECYGNGSLHLPVDHDRAFSLYVQASKQAHPAATYRTAVCYEVGAGTKRDSGRAMQFYRKAAALGDTAAMYKLGMILMNGLLGQGRNPREGVTWLKRAAAQADESTPHALHELALLYEGSGTESAGSVVIPDPAHAHELYLRAAQLGYAPSQHKLGYCYEYGLLNLPVDPRRSIAWYTRAAEQQEPEAELSLSGWYLTGAEGVLRQSDTEAYLWARKAADKGLAKAEYAVGYYSEHGVGVRPDLEEARRWYLRAAAQGHKRSIQKVKELKGVLYGGAGTRAGSERAGEWRKKGEAKDGDCVVM